MRFLLFLFLSISSISVFAQNDALLTKSSTEFKRLNAEGLAFRIQVGAYRRNIPNPDQFFGLTGVLAYDMGDGIIRYVSTYNYGDIESAELEKEEIIAKGVTDAFIIPFWGNERISQQKAIEILEGKLPK